jgi:hypothetical protein
MHDGTEQSWRRAKLDDWLFAMLRFAVTLDHVDRINVMSIAEDLDSFGSRVSQVGFRFFTRTSSQFCEAAANRDDPERVMILRRFLRTIDDAILRRLFAVATEIDTSGADPVRVVARA